MRYERANIEEILTDGPEAGRFSFSFEPDAGDIADSIRQIGLVRPPLLRRKDTKCDVVCGFRRVLACKMLGMQEIAALVCNANDVSDERCLWLNLVDTDCPARLSPVECAVALKKFAAVGYEKERLAREIAPRLGLPASPRYMEDCLKLLSFDAEILQAVHDGIFGVQQAFSLLKLDDEERVPVFRIARSCRANVNETRDLASLIPDVAAMKGVSVAEYTEAELAPIVADESAPPRKRLNRVSDHLNRRHHPRRSKAESALESVVGAMKLDERCRIFVPRHFEGDEITITIKARNLDEVENVLGALSSDGSKQSLSRLFSVIKGEEIP